MFRLKTIMLESVLRSSLLKMLACSLQDLIHSSKEVSPLIHIVSEGGLLERDGTKQKAILAPRSMVKGNVQVSNGRSLIRHGQNAFIFIRVL